jgi:1-acyl-sn-glycerol-3-phosphate acyltransferase
MPDIELRPQVYKDPRPKEYFDRYHERVRDHEPEPVYEAVRIVTQLTAVIAFRARGYGSERVPNGPVILAPNHASFMDHFFTGAFIRRRIQFMGKSQLFGPNPFSWIFSHGGVFPVRRGFQDEEAFKSAFAILERGGTIVMYCEGGRSRTGKLADSARPGIGRLALESGVPVVPVAILGSYQVRNWKRLHFPKVTVQYGHPLKFEVIPGSSREQQQQATDLIFARMRELHGELERRGHAGARRASRAAYRRRSTAAPADDASGAAPSDDAATPSQPPPPSPDPAPRPPTHAS